MRLFLPPSIALTRRNCKAPASDPPFSIVNCPLSIFNFITKTPRRSIPSPRRSFSLSPAAPAAVHAAVQVRHLSLRGGHELLELVLKDLVRGLRHRGRGRSRRTPLGGRTGAASRRGGTEGAGTLLLGQGLLDGEVDLPVLRGEDLDFDGLPLLQEIVDVVDIGGGDLGDMYRPERPPSSATNAPNFMMLVTFPSRILPTSGSIPVSRST